MARKLRRRNRKGNEKTKAPTFNDCLSIRDFVGAYTVLKHASPTGLIQSDEDQQLWSAYCLFHQGNFEGAKDVYLALTSLENTEQNISKDFTDLFAVVYYHLRMFEQAKDAATEGPNTQIKKRILYHAYDKLDRTTKSKDLLKKLSSPIEDQICIAAMHFNHQRYHDAIDIYKRILLDHKDYTAINVYIAMCYFKLDYYDVSLEILSVYLQSFPDSIIANNLKACNHFRLYNREAAEAELKEISSNSNSFSTNDLIKHNKVVFCNGENALHVLPSLIDVIPEAKLNLVIYNLRKEDFDEAECLLVDSTPSTTNERILKGIICATNGQSKGNQEMIKQGQSHFEYVGSSSSECDTIPGRQSMASNYFLLEKFDEANVYFSSIESYMRNDCCFNFNYGVSLAADGNFKQSEEILLRVHDDNYICEFCYMIWLARCFIMNDKPQNAWDMYLKLESASDSYDLLQLIANDCYINGHFLYSAKAFNLLENIEQIPENWEGKRGACLGVFQQVAAAKLKNNTELPYKVSEIKEVLAMLQASSSTQAENIYNVLNKWFLENLSALSDQCK